MIIEQEQPDAGALKIGETVQLAYVDQSRDSLDPEKIVFEEISQGDDRIKVGKREIPARAYVASFAFKGSDQQTALGVHGARRRLALQGPA